MKHFPHILIEWHPVGHVLHIEGTQEEVTALLALAILGSPRLEMVVRDALDAQEYLRERKVEVKNVDGQMLNIDKPETVN